MPAQTSASTISGSGNLTKAGSGSLFLASDNNNTYSGATAVSGGTLGAACAGSLPGYGNPSKLSVAASAMLLLSTGTTAGLAWTPTDVATLASANSAGFASGSLLGLDTSAGNFSFGGSLAGSMGVAKFGGNTLTLYGSNGYSGITTVRGGTLEVASPAALSNYSNTSSDMLSVGSGAALILAISPTGWNSTSVASFLASANTAGFASGATFGIDTSGGNFTYGSLNCATKLTKLGANTLSLTGASTFAGPTTVAGGTLLLANSGALLDSTVMAPNAASLVFSSSVSPAAFTFGGLGGSGNLNLQNSASSAMSLSVGNNNASTTYSGNLVGLGSLTKIGTGLLTLTGSNSFAGSATISAGTLQLGSGVAGYDGSLAGNITDNSWLVYDIAGSQNYSGSITGTSGNLVKTGSGIVVLSGNNSYNTTSGTTFVTGGTLEAASTAALPGYATAHKISVGSGATLAVSAGTSWTTANITSLSTSADFAAGSALGIDTTTASATYGNTLSGSFGLTKLGGNSLLVNGSNSYNGTTNVSAGTLVEAAPSALPGYGTSSRLAVANSAALMLDVGGSGWQTADVNSLLSHNGSGFAAGSTLDLDTSSVSGTFYCGAINGNMGLSKLGSNTLAMTAASTLAGPTTISAGTLAIFNGSALQNSTLTVPSSSVASIALGSTSMTFGGLSGSGNLSLQSTGSSPVALTVGRNNANTTYAGNLTGSGSLTMIGAGSLTLTGSNACASVTINGGDLVVASTGVLTTGTNSTNNLYVGRTAAGNLTISDSAYVQVGGGLDIDSLYTGLNPSTLTLNGGTLSIAGSTTIGRAGVRSDPSNSNAAFYQSGGSAAFGGQVIVGDLGTATSLYELSGGTARASSGLGMAVGYGGNGELDISGSGVLAVVGGPLTVARTPAWQPPAM